MSDIEHRIKKLEQQTGINEKLPRLVFVSYAFKPEGDREAVIDKIIADYEATHPAETCYLITDDGQVDESIANRLRSLGY
jgi:hypothetical protein